MDVKVHSRYLYILMNNKERECCQLPRSFPWSHPYFPTGSDHYFDFWDNHLLAFLCSCIPCAPFNRMNFVLMESHCMYVVCGGVLHLLLNAMRVMFLQAVAIAQSFSRLFQHWHVTVPQCIYPVGNIFCTQCLQYRTYWRRSVQQSSYWKQTEMLCTALCGSPILNQPSYLSSLVHIQAADGC